MKPIFFLLLIGICPSLLAVSQGEIIQVTRRLQMRSEDPKPPKEFYINLGSRNGVREGDILEVNRSVSVLHAGVGDEAYLLPTVMAELKVVLVGENVSLAREYESRQPAQLPPLDNLSVMLGDEVVLKGGLPFQE